MGMLIHRHLAEIKPEKPAKPVENNSTKAAAPVRKPGRPKKT